MIYDKSDSNHPATFQISNSIISLLGIAPEFFPANHGAKFQKQMLRLQFPY